MLRPAWLTMQGLILLYGVHRVLVMGVLNGRTSTIGYAWPIVAASVVAIVLLYQQQVEPAAIVGAVLGLYVMRFASDYRMPVSLVFWSYVGVMVWGAAATFSTGVSGQLLTGGEPSSDRVRAPFDANPMPLRYWRVLTYLPFVLSILGLGLGLLGAGLSYLAANEPGASGWEGLGILVGGFVAVVSLIVLLAGITLVSLARRHPRVAVSLGMPLSLSAIIFGSQYGSTASTLLVIWGLAHLVSAIAVLNQPKLAAPVPIPPPPLPHEAIQQ